LFLPNPYSLIFMTFSFLISPFDALLLSPIIFCFVCTCNKTIWCEIDILKFFCSLRTLDSMHHNKVDAQLSGSLLWWNGVFPLDTLYSNAYNDYYFLDLLIETWIKTNNFIIKRPMWLFIDKKIHWLIVMDFWNWKIWTSHLIKTSQNGTNYIDSHSKFVIEIQYMM
jgi:hypothetical protein